MRKMWVGDGICDRCGLGTEFRGGVGLGAQPIGCGSVVPSPVVIPAPLMQFARGFFMGAADIVPGVSGGTVALILGIYRRFVNQIRAGAHALKQLVTGDIGGGIESLRRIEWIFLIPLGAGAVSAFLVLRGPMKTALEEHSELTAAAFCGLVLASCWLVWNEMSDHDGFRVAVAAVVAIAAFVLLGYQNGAVSDPNLESLTTEALTKRRRLTSILLAVMIGVGILDVATAVVTRRWELLGMAAVLAFFAVLFAAGRKKIDEILSRRE